jgi:hypothetical protein
MKTEDLSTKRDSKEWGIGVTKDNQQTRNEGKSQEDTGTSPKRSKMRVDRHGPNPQERSRSLPRRTPFLTLLSDTSICCVIC